MPKKKKNKKDKSPKSVASGSGSQRVESIAHPYDYPLILKTYEAYNEAQLSYFFHGGAFYDLVYDCTQPLGNGWKDVFLKRIYPRNLNLNLLCSDTEIIQVLGLKSAQIYYLFRSVEDIDKIKWIANQSPDLRVYPILDCDTPPDFFREGFEKNPFKHFSDQVTFLLGQHYQPTFWPEWLTEIAVGFTTDCGAVTPLENLPVDALMFLNPTYEDWYQRLYPGLKEQIKLAMLPVFLNSYSFVESDLHSKSDTCILVAQYLSENVTLQPLELYTQIMFRGQYEQLSVPEQLSYFLHSKKVITVPRERVAFQNDKPPYWMVLLQDGGILTSLTKQQKRFLPEQLASVTLGSTTRASIINMLSKKKILRLTCKPYSSDHVEHLKSSPMLLKLYLPQVWRAPQNWTAGVKRLKVYVNQGNTKEDLACLRTLQLGDCRQVEFRIESPEVDPEVIAELENYQLKRASLTAMIFHYPDVSIDHLRQVPANQLDILCFEGWKNNSEVKIQVLRHYKKILHFVPTNAEDLTAYLEDLPRTQFPTLLEFIPTFSGEIKIPKAALPFILAVVYNISIEEELRLLHYIPRTIPKISEFSPEEAVSFVAQCVHEANLRIESGLRNSDYMELSQILKLDRSQRLEYLRENFYCPIAIKNSDLSQDPEAANQVQQVITMACIATQRVRPRRFLLDSDVAEGILSIRPHNEISCRSPMSQESREALDPNHVLVMEDSGEVEHLRRLAPRTFFFRMETTNKAVVQFVNEYARGVIVHPSDPIDLSMFTEIENFEFVALTVDQARKLPETVKQIRLHAAEAEALECLPRHLEIVLLGQVALECLQGFTHLSICSETPKEMLYLLDVPTLTLFPGAESLLSLLPRRKTRMVYYEGVLEKVQKINSAQQSCPELFVVLSSIECIDVATISDRSFKLAVRSLPVGVAIPKEVYWCPDEAVCESLECFPKRWLLSDAFVPSKNREVMANLQAAEEIFLNFSCENLLQDFVDCASRTEAEIDLVISSQSFDLWLDHVDALFTLMQKFPKAHITSEALRDEAIYGRYLRLCARNIETLSSSARPCSEFPATLESFLDTLPFRNEWRRFPIDQQIKIWEGFQRLTPEQRNQTRSSNDSIKQKIQEWLLLDETHDARSVRVLWQDLFPNVSGSGLAELALRDEQPKGEEPVYHWTVSGAEISSASENVYCVASQYFLISESVDFSVGAELTHARFFTDALGQERVARAKGQSGIKFFDDSQGSYPTTCREIPADQERASHQVVELKPQNGVTHRWRLFSSACYIEEQGKRLYVLDTLQEKPKK